MATWTAGPPTAIVPSLAMTAMTSNREQDCLSAADNASGLW
jgi:hypothetical protein